MGRGSIKQCFLLWNSCDECHILYSYVRCGLQMSVDQQREAAFANHLADVL